MKDLSRIFDNVQVAIVVADADTKIIYANDRCKKIFKELLNAENFVGKSMNECHQPETVEKLRRLFQDYREKKRALDYYVMDIPEGKATIVNVPFYEGDVFSGVVEFVFESSLA